jgi:hypothetical protein
VAVERHRSTLMKHVPGWSRFVRDLLAQAAPAPPRTKSRTGTIPVQLPVDSVSEEWARQLAKVALQQSGARAHVQSFLDEFVSEASVEPITDLAGVLHVAVMLRPWARVRSSTRKSWRELCENAAENGDEFERTLGRSCKRALRKLRPSPSP